MNEKVDGLIVIGGDGSLAGALALDKMGFPGDRHSRQYRQ